MSMNQSLTHKEDFNNNLTKDKTMLIVPRRITHNLVRNGSLQSQSKFILPFTSAYQKINNPFLRFSSSDTPKQNLLKYPVLNLNDTLQKYTKTIEPILNAKELEKSISETQNFCTGDGAKLQRILEEEAACTDNWLAPRWLRAAYLQYRTSVIAYSSPAMVFPTVQFCSDDEFLEYAANCVFMMIKYKELIDQGKIPIQKMGKLELDNSQFYKVFGTCRIPGIKEDALIYNPKSTHIVVIYKNHFYKLSPYTRKGNPLHPNVILNELKNIYKSERVKGPDYGILSSDHRDNWGVAYSELISIPGNSQKIKIIQSSLFTVSLDDEVPITFGKDDMKVSAEQLLHGGGLRQNGGNRWFDKTIQLIINRNGVNGFCYEHSPAEGQPIALMADYIIANLGKKEIMDTGEIPKSGDKCAYEPTEKLELTTSSSLDEHIKKATTTLNEISGDLLMNILHYECYGKGFLKKQKLSPDSFVQMALQYAFYKMHKVPGAAYESAHLRIYQNGRTETIRSCSNDSMEFACAMTSNQFNNQQRAVLLRKAVASHQEYAKMALQGQGVDRHLLGLKLMAIENRLPIPDFYKSVGFVKSSHFRLSTSQVASVNKAFMCYGNTVNDGYGCCYNPRENDIIVAISSWKSNAETNADRFAVALSEAFTSMKEVLAENPPSKL